MGYEGWYQEGRSECPQAGVRGFGEQNFFNSARASKESVRREVPRLPWKEGDSSVEW